MKEGRCFPFHGAHRVWQCRVFYGVTDIRKSRQGGFVPLRYRGRHRVRSRYGLVADQLPPSFQTRRIFLQGYPKCFRHFFDGRVPRLRIRCLAGRRWRQCRQVCHWDVWYPSQVPGRQRHWAPLIGQGSAAIRLRKKACCWELGSRSRGYVQSRKRVWRIAVISGRFSC